MSETTLVGLIAGASALLGVWITQKHNQKKWISEEKRWYANFFLGRKVDALHNLYGALVDCYFVIKFYAHSPPATLKEFIREVATKENAYLRAKVMASLFLDDKEDKIMTGALDAFRQANITIWLSLPDGEIHQAIKDMYSETSKIIDFKGLTKTYEATAACLRKRLNPNTLEHIEKF